MEKRYQKGTQLKKKEKSGMIEREHYSLIKIIIEQKKFIRMTNEISKGKI